MAFGFIKSEPKEPVQPFVREAPDFSGERGHEKLLKEIEKLGVGAFWASDPEGRLIFLSDQALKSLGPTDDSVIGRPLNAIFREAEAAIGAAAQRTLSFKLKTRSKVEDHIVEIVTRHIEGEEPAKRWWRISGKPMADLGGEFLGYRGSIVDITQQYVHDLKISQQSQIDELTGLSNRRRLSERLAVTLAAFKNARRSCALLMLDLDRFKQVNDTMGHQAGDELLRQVGKRLVSLVKERGEVGRLGGDEFQLLLPDMDDRGALGDLANRIVQSLSQPYQINGKRAIIGTSVGIAIAPYDGLDAEELTKAADMALYAAKENRGTFRFYTSELSDEASRAAVLQNSLRDALHTGEIRMAYQPLVDPNTNAVRCFEALMRWEHPEEGPISPALFIPIAEENDLIGPLGEFALRQACADALTWPGNIRVAVNVSAKQFMKPDFRKIVATALETSGLPAERLELEITESVFVGDLEQVDKIFLDLKKLGVRLSLDDFGTGYSSLGYLKNGHFDKLKIDQSFVRGCTENGEINPAIISAIVALAKALGMETVAEGVEAMDELAMVKERGADLVQGYIYSRPLKQDDVLAQFETGQMQFKPDGPPRHRSERITIFRKIGLIHEDHYYDVILRNLSKTGARINGLAGVPIGTDVVLDLGNGQLVVSKVVNATESSQGLKFETALISDGCGGFMTRHRISPYLLAEAGIPLAALGAGAFPLAKWRETHKSLPKFVQLELGS